MGFVFDINCQHKVEGQKFKNLAAEQRSSQQSCTVRPETSAGQSSLVGIYRLVVRSITYFPTPFWSSLGLPLRFSNAQQITCVSLSYVFKRSTFPHFMKNFKTMKMHCLQSLPYTGGRKQTYRNRTTAGNSNRLHWYDDESRSLSA